MIEWNKPIMLQKQDMEGKYLTTSDYNKFTNEILDAKKKNKKLINKYDTSEFTNNSDLDKKIKH